MNFAMDNGTHSKSSGGAGSNPRAFASIKIFTTPNPALKAWETLEQHSGATAYQGRAFNIAWYKFLCRQENARPLIIIAYDADSEPVLLVPLAVYRRGPVRIAMYAGGRHANLNMPLLRSGVDWTMDDTHALITMMTKKARLAIDLLALYNQPIQWSGQINPLAALHNSTSYNSPSPSNAYGAMIGQDGEAFLLARESKAARKKLRNKAQRLAETGVVNLERAASPERARTILSVFVEQKTIRFSQKNKDAGFSRVAVRQFLDALATDPQRNGPALDLYALTVGAKIIAIFGGLRHGAHWHGLFNSYNCAPEFSRLSPGQILLHEIIHDLSKRGVTHFDLGVGEARYKDALCNETIDLRDIIIATSFAGRLFAPIEVARQFLKRKIKKTPWALALVERMRAGPV